MDEASADGTAGGPGDRWQDADDVEDTLDRLAPGRRDPPGRSDAGPPDALAPHGGITPEHRALGRHHMWAA
ncbi:hypothetical protein [Streptomyces beihaiensis]|uniref:Uncharacterized protein n=1 Tax=Streptomyces beihaiensis TaxID=2984495 RepID=A0ABT3TYE3_9ACTN|nr:hypothetical protein [Streptomyces beihaiensis]MCX3062064.1 hypothetical protein [Streptomyces beihaiensis]